MKKYDTIIIGAGAAGLFCATQAGKRGRKVLLLDHHTKAGAKILISGGGRCNFTNLNTTAENFVSQNPHFCKSALSQFTPHHFLEMVRKHSIPFVDKKVGQLFCQNSAKDILKMLLDECAAADVSLSLSTTVLSIENEEGLFRLQTTQGVFQSETLVIATGGLSLPQIGATGFGYEIAKQFGLTIVPTAPALDGFTGNAAFQAEWKTLSGISLPATITTKVKSFEEDLLITHHGISGPAALQASLYWRAGENLTINWLPSLSLSSWLLEKKTQGEKKILKNILAQFWSERLTEHLAKILDFPTRPLLEISNQELVRLAEAIQQWTWSPPRTVGYARAEVTRGGVDTDELSSKTMECRKVPGLFFIGEVMDVTGELGGYNFQWAWSSGWVAGQNI